MPTEAQDRLEDARHLRRRVAEVGCSGGRDAVDRMYAAALVQAKIDLLDKYCPNPPGWHWSAAAGEDLHCALRELHDG